MKHGIIFVYAALLLGLIMVPTPYLLEHRAVNVIWVLAMFLTGGLALRVMLKN